MDKRAWPKTINDLTRDEKNLLLYIETRAVDHTCKLLSPHLNDDDIKILEQWNKLGFVTYNRIAYEYVERGLSTCAILTDEAFTLAHALRVDRAKRMYKERNYETTQELRKSRAEE